MPQTHKALLALSAPPPTPERKGFLDEVAARYPGERIRMVFDGTGWRKSQAIQLPSNLRLLPLPAYAPELNPVEILWDEVRGSQRTMPVGWV